MFKFLKDKLSKWIKRSRKQIEEKKEEEPKRVEKEQEERAEKEIEKTQKIAAKVEEKEKTPHEAVKELEEEEEKKEKEEEEKEKSRAESEKKEAEEEGEEEEGGEGKEKEQEERAEKEIEKKEKSGIFEKLRKKFAYKITKSDFDSIFKELELLLLENNAALEVVEKIREDLSRELIGKEVKKQELEAEIKLGLKKTLEDVIIEPDDILETIKSLNQNEKPFKAVFFGINGSGKTTTIAKFAHLLKKNNLSCVLAAADTFRAASIEQLQIHADRLGIKVIKHDYGADPAAVAFDAVAYASKHKIDVVLIDTAGRMHTKSDLLREMEKICRVAKPNLKIFVAEAIAGNDAVEQARIFNKEAGIDGSILSKTDIDEKGGTVISISHATGKPILYLGVGQNLDDLKLFNKQEFIESLGL